MLIFKMEGFEGTKRQAQEAETALERARTELSSLQVEIESLKKQREALAPTIVDWEKRLSDKAEAQAALTALEGKRRQAEADVAQAAKRLEDTNKDLASVEKKRAELLSELEKLKAERLSLTKVITAAKVSLDQTMEAERRVNEAQSALVSFNARRKQIEVDIADVQKRRDQIQREADEARKERDRLADEGAKLRQQVQTLKDERTDLEQRISGLKAIQVSVQQEELKLEQTRGVRETGCTRARVVRSRKHDRRTQI
jgi:chromosome segregation ATPase